MPSCKQPYHPLAGITAPGFFKMIKMSSALLVKESAANAAKLYQSVKEVEAKMQEEEEKTSPSK